MSPYHFLTSGPPPVALRPNLATFAIISDGLFLENFKSKLCFVMKKPFEFYIILGVKPVKNGRSMRFYHPWLAAPAARQFIDVK